MVEIRYICKRSFCYGDRQYKPGDEFIPAGGKFDSKIIANHTRTERIEVDEEPVREEKRRVKHAK